MKLDPPGAGLDQVLTPDGAARLLLTRLRARRQTARLRLRLALSSARVPRAAGAASLGATQDYEFGKFLPIFEEEKGVVAELPSTAHAATTCASVIEGGR